MNKKKLLRKEGPLPNDVLPDLGDIANNPEAQRYLLERVGDLPPEKRGDEMVRLFGDVYTYWQNKADNMSNRRQIIRDGARERGENLEPSYTREEEDNIKDNLAKLGTSKTMGWLKDELERRDKDNSPKGISR